MKMFTLIAIMIISQTSLAFAESKTVEVSCGITSLGTAERRVEKKLTVLRNMAVLDIESQSNDGMPVEISALINLDPSSGSLAFGSFTVTYSDGREIGTTSFDSAVNIILKYSPAEGGKTLVVSCSALQP